MNQIYADYAGSSRMMSLLAKAGELQQELEAGDFYELETTIQTVAEGLGHHGDGDGSSG